MKRSVSAHITFRSDKVENGIEYFHKTLEHDKSYTAQEVMDEICTSLVEILNVPGSNMHILLHVSKDVEGE